MISREMFSNAARMQPVRSHHAQRKWVGDIKFENPLVKSFNWLENAPHNEMD
jgi:hypothetical protein